MDAPVLPLSVRERRGRDGAAYGDSCLYGSVVGLDKARTMDAAAVAYARPHARRDPSPSPALVDGDGDGDRDGDEDVAAAVPTCDECEERRARFECGDCGLAYCAPCDARRHRKGKLVFHQRARLHAATYSSPVAASDASVASPASSSASLASPSVSSQSAAAGGEAVVDWGVAQVADWLRANDLDVFVDDAQALGLDGPALLASARVDTFIEAAACAASRGHKKKLQREALKLREAEQVASPASPFVRGPASVARMGLNLRVDVSPRTSIAVGNGGGGGGAEAASFSPVAALRARLAHGQTGDDARGRVLRRRSAFPGSAAGSEASASSPRVSGSGNGSGRSAMTEKRSRSLFLGAGALKIDVDTPPPPTSSATSASTQLIGESGSSSVTKRQLVGLGALDLDMGQVKREENALGASFDFSATGRLQTQGFEINTNGIANVPFPTRYHAIRREAASPGMAPPQSSAAPLSASASSGNLSSPPSSTSMGTRDYLLILNELGHGASGKVYKALYIPTFKLVAVKVIRVYDQKKRHQMVRELKSLYVNFVPIAEADAVAEAACEELVVFYDAFTNPEAGSVSIVLEYMDGGSMEDCMRAADGAEVSEHALANLAHCVLRGLAFLHEHHQLHRDIKLSNMLINHAGQVKISDFGISRDLESTLAKATTFTGTLLYMAPERISGGMYSYPSDIWSFGLAVMAYAVGRLPVPTQDGYWGVVHAVQEKPSPRLQDFGSHFSPELCDFIDQCLQKNPLGRPSASQLLRHPFITTNYRSPRESSSAALFPGLGDATYSDADKKSDELETIAAKVESWCQAHAETLLAATSCQSPSSSAFHRVPVAQKAEALARQLRLPRDQVTARFNFLERFCPTK